MIVFRFIPAVVLVLLLILWPPEPIRAEQEIPVLDEGDREIIAMLELLDMMELLETMDLLMVMEEEKGE